MRWLVEVTALGKSDKESFFLEADSWQKALQGARSRRGDNAPMSGFSIELLDDGCRAVDPVSRVRYDVRKAPDEAASAGSQLPASHAPAAARPASHATAPAAAHAPDPSARTQPAASPIHAPTANPDAGLQVPHAAAPTHAALPPVSAVAAPRPTPASVAAGADVAVSVASQIIFKREQDPTDAMPLTYREYVYLVPPATTEAHAEALVSTQLELIRASLERLPPGKLVNLGVFDVAFQGKPPVPPLATLAWKDWRGAPVVSFPRRAPVAPAPPAMQAAVAPQGPAPAAFPPARVAPAAPAPVLPAQTYEVPASVQSAFAPTLLAPPVVAPTYAVPVPPAPPAAAPAPPTPGAARPPSGSGRAITPGSRVRGEDLIADLFEAMHELHFVHDAIEAGEFCLTLALQKLPSQAGIVHLYDIDRREFLVTSTRGNGTGKLLLRRHPEGDVLLQAAMARRRAIVIADATTGEGGALERFALIGGARSLMIAPIMQHGRFLGAIELLNPLDGQPFTDAEGNALNYIAEQFAEFLAAHGVVTDPERISARHLPGA